MNDPWYRFKSQPWQALLKVSALTIAIVIVLEQLLLLAVAYSQLFQRSLSLLFFFPLNIILPLAAAVGIGALSVYICDRWQRFIFLNAGSLWALVLCLALGLLLKSWLPIPSLLVDFSYYSVIGMLVGVFWKGRPYWR